LNFCVDLRQKRRNFFLEILVLGVKGCGLCGCLRGGGSSLLAERCLRSRSLNLFLLRAFFWR